MTSAPKTFKTFQLSKADAAACCAAVFLHLQKGPAGQHPGMASEMDVSCSSLYSELTADPKVNCVLLLHEYAFFLEYHMKEYVGGKKLINQKGKL